MTTIALRCVFRSLRWAASRGENQRSGNACAKTFPGYFAAVRAPGATTLSALRSDDERAPPPMRPVIAIGGPAASGKGTIAQRCRQRRWVTATSTAARFTGWWRCEALRHKGVWSMTEPRLAALADGLDLSFTASGRTFLSGQDVTRRDTRRTVSRDGARGSPCLPRAADGAADPPAGLPRARRASWPRGGTWARSCFPTPSSRST